MHPSDQEERFDKMALEEPPDWAKPRAPRPQSNDHPGTGACPHCGSAELPVTVQRIGDCRYFGWSCANCGINGVSGICPPPSGSGGDDL